MTEITKAHLKQLRELYLECPDPIEMGGTVNQWIAWLQKVWPTISVLTIAAREEL